MLRKATFNVSESGWESLGYQFEIRGGDYDGRSDFVTFGTLDTWETKDGRTIDLGWSVEKLLNFSKKLLFWLVMS